MTPTLTYGDGKYSCAACGEKFCDHWKKLLESAAKKITCKCGDGGCIACWPSNFTQEALVEYVHQLRVQN